VWAQLQRCWLVALEGELFVILREGTIEMCEQRCLFAAEDEVNVARYACFLPGAELHRHAASGDEHGGSVVVDGACQRAGEHH
jgi:hypothetical protein